MSIARLIYKTYESIAEAKIIHGLNINDGFFRLEVRRKLMVTTTRQWDVLHYAKYELKNDRKHNFGLFGDKRGVKFFDSLK